MVRISFSAHQILGAALGIFLLCSAGCASTQGGEAGPPSGHQVEAVKTIFISVEYNEKMHANIGSIKEMANLLRETLQDRLADAGYSTEPLASPGEFRPAADHYLLKVRLDDYHGGLHKTLYIQYEFSGDGLPTLINQTKLTTAKGASKLARVLAKQLAVIVDQRLRAEMPRGSGTDVRN